MHVLCMFYSYTYFFIFNLCKKKKKKNFARLSNQLQAVASQSMVSQGIQENACVLHFTSFQSPRNRKYPANGTNLCAVQTNVLTVNMCCLCSILAFCNPNAILLI